MSITDADERTDDSDSNDPERPRRLVSDGSGSAIDRFFRLLANQRRRFVMYHLSERGDEGVGIDDLVSRIVTWETYHRDDPPDPSNGEYRDRIVIDLKHNHLPKLDAHGVIDYDERSDTVRNRDELLRTDWLECVKAAELE